MAIDPFTTALAGIVGGAHVLTDPAMMAAYEADWTRRWRGGARCVVRPGDTDEVAAVLGACHEAGAPVVPQGGNTGLVGGGVPRQGEVVLSLTRLADLDPVDEAAVQVTVGAGATLADVRAHVAPHGLDVGVDLASRDSATIGGMVATNAGGVHVLRHGPMRRQVVGVEAVLADGRVIRRLEGLARDNTGYDLPGLLAGSEGTLAVITRVRLALVPVPRVRVTALLAVEGIEDALVILARLRRLPSLGAAEIVWADGVALVCRHTGCPPPFAEPHPAYLLVECTADDDPTEVLAETLARTHAVRDAAVATDRQGRQRLWAYRERHTEAINAAGVPHKLDVTLPLGALAAFEREVRGCVAEHSARVILFGHLGDGNLHVNVLDPPPGEEAVDDAVLRLAAAYGGSISAEHGIGVAKARWLHLTRSEADRAAMAAIKRAFDPSGILNPGVIFT
ncbi:MAG: FAD-binding oxidoreductase [Egibacteraceae bacterium]